MLKMFTFLSSDNILAGSVEDKKGPEEKFSFDNLKI